MDKSNQTKAGAPMEKTAPAESAVQREQQLRLPLNHECAINATDVAEALKQGNVSQLAHFDYKVSDHGTRLILFEKKLRAATRFEDENARRAGELSKQRHLNLNSVLRREFGLLSTG